MQINTRRLTIPIEDIRRLHKRMELPEYLADKRKTFWSLIHSSSKLAKQGYIGKGKVFYLYGVGKVGSFTNDPEVGMIYCIDSVGDVVLLRKNLTTNMNELRTKTRSLATSA